MIYFIIIDPILILNLIVYLSYLELFCVSLLIMIKLTEILRGVILFINAHWNRSSVFHALNWRVHGIFILIAN